MLSDCKILKHIPVLIILLMTTRIVNAMHLGGKLFEMYIYSIYFVLDVYCLTYYFRHYRTIRTEYRLMSWIYNIMLAYLVFGLIKLMYGEPSGIWPWQRFVAASCCIFFGVIFILLNEECRRSVFRLYWKWLPVIFLGTFIFNANEMVYPMAFVIFCLCFHRFMPKRKRYASYFILIMVFYFSMYQRIDYITVLIPLSLIFLYNVVRSIRIKKLNFIFGALFLIPFFLLYLGFTGKFNVLNMESYMGEYESSKAGKVTDDTRTFLYEEAYTSSIANGYVCFGRTPYYGYDSYFASMREGNSYTASGAYAQRISEVGIINIYTMFGVFGVILFILFYWNEGHKGLASQNAFLKCLSIWVVFFWCESWISHIWGIPSSNYFILYLVIAMINDKRLRSMNEREITVYMKGLMKL